MTVTVDFEPITHTYAVDGIVRPSVTYILRVLGISADFEAIGAMSERLRAQIELKRAVGSALHADIHAFDDNDLDEASVDPLVRPYLESWKTFRRNSGLVPEARERRVFHAALNYCGTLDGIFSIPAQPGERILVDVKTGDPADAGAPFQLALYWLAYLDQHPDDTLTQRWSVQLTPDNGIAYRIHPYTDWQDFETARCIVAAFHARRSR